MEIISLKSPADSSADTPADSPVSPIPRFPKHPPKPRENKITALKPAVRTQGRVNVFIDDEFAFSLDLAQVVDFRLKIGKILTPEEIATLRSASEFGKLYAATLEWVLMRPRSIKETRDYLALKLRRRELENLKRVRNAERLAANPELRARQKDLKLKTKPLPLFSQDDIEQVISRLLAKGYLDDEAFAKFYIENRFVKKGVSARRLEVELAKKGIDKNLIDDLLASSSRSDTEEIQKVIAKKGPKSTPEKLLRLLLSRGFPYDLSKSAVEEFFAANEDQFLKGPIARPVLPASKYLNAG